MAREVPRVRDGVEAARPAIVSALAAFGVTGFSWFASYEGAPVIWLATTTDAERDVVLAQGSFVAPIRVFLAEAGVPEPYAVDAYVTAESQETVDRDFGGDWHLATR